MKREIKSSRLALIFSVMVLVLFLTVPLTAQQKENRGQGQNNKEVQGAGKDKKPEKNDNKPQGNKDQKDNKGTSASSNKRGGEAANGGKNPPAMPVHPNKAKKVTICHKGDDGKPVTITVSENAINAHLAHGDSNGPCPVSATADQSAKPEVRERLFTKIENTREWADYGEEIIRVAEERLRLGKLRLDQAILGQALEEAAINESREIIQAAEQELELLKRQVSLTRAEIDRTQQKAISIFR